MPRLHVVGMTLTLLLVGSCGVQRPTAELEPSGPGDGPYPGYTSHVWMEARGIPDGDRQGILMGPVTTEANGETLGAITLRLGIRHPTPGDLAIWLAYDADEDGELEARARIEFFRSRSEVQAEELHACPASLGGVYYFRDGASAEEASFAPFEALPRGHAFYLSVADTLAGGRGTVLGWAVYTKDPEPLASR